MVKTEADWRQREVGRVVFPKNADNLNWRVLTLKCHVDNVARLAKSWSHAAAYLHSNEPRLAMTQDALGLAAEIHDDAKPQKFRLDYKANKRFGRGQPEWSYSFAGHRFEVPSTGDIYVDELVRMHHEYSVEGITESMAKLRLDQRYVDAYRNFPLDLYALEMADQIEATLARAALDAEDPEGRVFMDFDFDTLDAAQRIYRIDPFPFAVKPPQIRLKIEYAHVQAPQDIYQSICKIYEEDPRNPNLRRQLSELRDFLLDELRAAALQERTVTVCKWQ